MTRISTALAVALPDGSFSLSVASWAASRQSPLAVPGQISLAEDSYGHAGVWNLVSFALVDRLSQGGAAHGWAGAGAGPGRRPVLRHGRREGLEPMRSWQRFGSSGASRGTSLGTSENVCGEIKSLLAATFGSPRRADCQPTLG
jgi:hypothetical protein